MNTLASVANPATFSVQMPNVIDSLKRLERIGSEESETVRKILEAAQELSRTACKAFPSAYSGEKISGYLDSEGVMCLGDYFEFDSEPQPRHRFSTYVVCGGDLFLNDTWVAKDRTTALVFASDIAHGLLDLFTLFIADKHRLSEEGFALIDNAVKSLKKN